MIAPPTSSILGPRQIAALEEARAAQQALDTVGQEHYAAYMTLVRRRDAAVMAARVDHCRTIDIHAALGISRQGLHKIVRRNTPRSKR